MAANLSKNGVTLMAAYQDVVDGRSETNWALFTYEGDSNDIRLAEKGEGGLEEMVEELSSGKVMYAFCCVKDPNSGLPKYVLINWVGEGVKDFCKGVYANHFPSIANFLKGAHVTINARAEEDVDPTVILAKVAKASGVNFNFQRQTNKPSHVARGPVGCVYEKTNAKDDIQKTDKDRFWTQTQREEEVHQQKSSKRVEAEKQKVEREKRELEERQAKERQNTDKEKSGKIIQNRSFQKIREIEKGKMEQQKTPVSVYKKINARDEIQKSNKDHFWAQTQKEEEDHRKESSRRVEAEKQRLEREKRELEERQAKERQIREKENNVRITQNTSFQRILEKIEKREIEPQKAAASVYKKINARDEIQKTDRDHFWAQAQEEEDRRKESSKRVEVEKQRVEREKIELEEKLAKEREKIEKKNFQTKREMEKEKQMTHTKVPSCPVHEEEARPNRTHQNPGIKFAESVQKANEAKLLISQRSFNPRDVFKQQNQQRPNLTNGASLTPQPGKLRSLFLSQNSSGERGAASPEHLRPCLSPSSPQVFRSAPGPPSSASSFPVGGVGYTASPKTLDQPAASPSPELYQNHEPPHQPADANYDDVEWLDEFEDDDDEFDEFDGEGEEVYQEIPPAGIPFQDQRLQARALYDYQAVDHREITFDPDDLITGIEKVDEGWWRGYAPNGHYGLFPANYVELI